MIYTSGLTSPAVSIVGHSFDGSDEKLRFAAGLVKSGILHVVEIKISQLENHSGAAQTG